MYIHIYIYIYICSLHGLCIISPLTTLHTLDVQRRVQLHATHCNTLHRKQVCTHPTLFHYFFTPTLPNKQKQQSQNAKKKKVKIAVILVQSGKDT